MKPRPELFGTLSRQALEDKHLQEALRGVDRRLRIARDDAFRKLPDAEGLRDYASRIRDHTLDHLDTYLEMLEENVTRAGGTVHWAKNAKSAVKVVEGLVESKGVRTIVKGKSMVSEEIGLNEALQAGGLEVLETDLGEYIIQLAQETPSHIVAPAIHKTRAQIAALFMKKLGAPPMDDPEDITHFARETLRKRFLEADMGITGANFVVASTGAVILFENEGNIRLSTTIPRIHLAITGIEKVVPGWEELLVLMQLLPRSAIGQKLPAYVSVLTGSRRQREPDGADEFHLVLVDNGRSRILADEEFRESLRCIRCGACLNICPVYLKAGGHAYGWVYSGPIGAVLTPQLIEDRRSASALAYATTLCGACSEVCPVKIDHPRLLTALRRRYADDPAWGPSTRSENCMFSLAGATLANRRLYEMSGRAARLFRPFFASGLRAFPFPPPALTAFRHSAYMKRKAKRGTESE